MPLSPPPAAIGRWLALSLACATVHVTGAAAAPGLVTNQSYVEGVMQSDDVAVGDLMAVFAFVFEALPARVKVYPTEDYYYFKFIGRGVTYGGNIRLENGTRDEGKVHFSFGVESTDEADEGTHKLLGAADGVTVEKVDRFAYRVAFRGKTVMFELNDLSTVTPPAQMLTSDERYIGPIFDESAMRFFLVYNTRLKLFHYLLDETAPTPDLLKPSRVSDRILVGQRTRFAFYRDPRRERKILIGVLEANARANNYFDGPFDQLPDNFLDGDTLRSAILEINPSLRGKIDRFGSSFDARTRYLIAPYLHYRQERELALFHRCAINRRVPPARYYACFAVDEDTPGDPPRTLAERPRGRR